MKNFITVFILSIFLLSSPVVVYGIRQAPGTTPLQPAPVDVQPNYSGNVQSGDGVERAQQSVGPTYDEIDQNEAVDGPNFIQTLIGEQDGDSSGSGLAVAMAVVFLSAFIAAAYYWYKTRKTK